MKNNEATINSPELGFIRRVLLYFSTMYPLPKAAIAAIIGFCSFYFFIAVLNADKSISMSSTWFAFVTLFLYSILFRLHDELKDEEFDRQFNPHRPLVTGLVKYRDIKILIVAIFITLALLNFNQGMATSVFLLLIVFLALSTRWFFFPEEVQKHFGLLTITHQPILPLVYYYIYTVYLDNTGEKANYLIAVPLFFLYSLPSIAWEIARKTRAPSDENGFPTYSSRWGVKIATCIPMMYIFVATLSWVTIGIVNGFSISFVIAQSILGLATLAVFARFLRRPIAKFNHLRQAIEAYDFGFRIIVLFQVWILLK
jgi:hypothetical protein